MIKVLKKYILIGISIGLIILLSGFIYIGFKIYSSGMSKSRDTYNINIVNNLKKYKFDKKINNIDDFNNLYGLKIKLDNCAYFRSNSNNSFIYGVKLLSEDSIYMYKSDYYIYSSDNIKLTENEKKIITTYLNTCR